jgi:exopolysaccharide biosynthesis polyprenyl glycosylphosphotransferase
MYTKPDSQDTATSTSAEQSNGWVRSQRVHGLDSDRRLFVVFLVIGDALILFLAFTLAYWLSMQSGAIGTSTAPGSAASKYLLLTMQLIGVWLLLFWVIGLYNQQTLQGGGVSEIVRVINACTIGMFSVVVVTFINRNIAIEPAWLVIAWVAAIAMDIGFRLLMRRFAFRSRAQGHFVVPALVVGINFEAMIVAEQLSNARSSGLDLAGFVDTQLNSNIRLTPSLPILGNLDRLEAVIKQSGIREVIAIRSALTDEELVTLSTMISSLSNVTLRLSSGLYEVFTAGMQVTTINSVPLMTVKHLRLSPMEAALKLLLDYSMVLLALPVLLPVMLIAALLIKFDSPGPIFRRRRLVGVGGREFDSFTFRTVREDADQTLSDKERDARQFTRIGRFLIRTSLNELPYTINILLGQVSLVGPRMMNPQEAAAYGQLKNTVLAVRPGLTGLWLMPNWRDLSYEERVRLDLYYVRNYSIWLDLHILFFQTLPAALGQSQYGHSSRKLASEPSYADQLALLSSETLTMPAKNQGLADKQTYTTTVGILGTADGEALEVGREYQLLVGVLGNNHTRASEWETSKWQEQTISVEAVVHGRNIDLTSSWFQRANFLRGRDSGLLRFSIMPRTPGETYLEVDFYCEQHWLSRTRLSVNVAEAQ